MYWSKGDVPPEEINHIWEITHDFIENEEGNTPTSDDDPTKGYNVGICGPSQYDDVKARFAALPEDRLVRVRFRLLDADEIPYYEGILVYDRGDDGYGADPLEAPLSDFGTPNAGAVLLDVWKDDEGHVCKHCGSTVRGRWVREIG